MSTNMSGGCQCGRIRYSVSLANFDAGLCHCSMCRKATGGFASAIVEVVIETVRWESEPDAFDSSPIAQRLFCSHCGSPLGWRPREGATMDLTLGSFDDPSPFRPVAHGGAERIVEAWLETADLPRHATASIPSTVARWREAGLEVPE
jgi:hypothetical protein